VKWAKPRRFPQPPNDFQLFRPLAAAASLPQSCTGVRIDRPADSLAGANAAVTLCDSELTIGSIQAFMFQLAPA
jgi:hypothetical protein